VPQPASPGSSRGSCGRCHHHSTALVNGQLFWRSGVSSEEFHCTAACSYVGRRRLRRPVLNACVSRGSRCGCETPRDLICRLKTPTMGLRQNPALMTKRAIWRRRSSSARRVRRRRLRMAATTMSSLQSLIRKTRLDRGGRRRGGPALRVNAHT
jgi:hypothetical protein